MDKTKPNGHAGEMNGEGEKLGAVSAKKLVDQVIKEEIGRLMREHRKKLVGRIRERLLTYGIEFDESGEVQP